MFSGLTIGWIKALGEGLLYWHQHCRLSACCPFAASVVALKSMPATTQPSASPPTPWLSRGLLALLWVGVLSLWQQVLTAYLPVVILLTVALLLVYFLLWPVSTIETILTWGLEHSGLKTMTPRLWHAAVGQHRIRWLSVSLLFFGGFLAVLWLWQTLMPQVLAQSQQLSQAIPGLLTTAEHHVWALLSPWQHQGWLPLTPETFHEQWQAGIQSQLLTLANNAFTSLLSGLPELNHWLASSVNLLSYGGLLLLLVFYSLFSGQRYVNQLVERSNTAASPTALSWSLHTADTTLKGYIRGQILLAALTGCYMGIIYSIFHVPYALILALWFGIAELIPVLGTWIGFTPGILIMLLSPDPLVALWVFACSYAYQTIKDNMLTPRIVGDCLGLHPVIVLLSLWFGAKLGGVLGVILALPIASFIWQWAAHYSAAPNNHNASAQHDTATPAPSNPTALVALLERPAGRSGWWLIFVGLGLLGLRWLLIEWQDYVTVLTLAIFIYALLHPLIRGLERTVAIPILMPPLSALLPKVFPVTQTTQTHHATRLLALLCVVFTVLLGVAILLAVTAPILLAQSQRLIAQLPQYVQHWETLFTLWYQAIPHWLLESTLPEPADTNASTVALSAAQALENLQSLLHTTGFATLLNLLQRPTQAMLNGALNIAGLSVKLGLFGFLVGVLVFYMLLDGPQLVRNLMTLIPPQHQHGLIQHSRHWRHQFQMLLAIQTGFALFFGVVLWVCLSVFHVPYALLLAAIGALMAIIPVVGGWLALAPVVFIGVYYAQWPLMACLMLAVWFLYSMKNDGVIPFLQKKRFFWAKQATHPLNTLVLLAFALHLGGALGILWCFLGVAVMMTLEYEKTYQDTHETSAPPT